MACGSTFIGGENYQLASSTTRPVGGQLYTGLRIFEGDTGRELLYDGIGWVIQSEPPQTFAMTVGNITKGNGVDASFYHRNDGWADVVFSFTLGSSSAVTGDPVITYPIQPQNPEMTFLGTIVDVTPGTRYFGASAPWTATQWVMSTNLYAAVSATVPMTWAVGDYFTFSARYRMTTRYS